VRHRIKEFCGACTGAPQNAYFCGEDSVEHHPCATECIYGCATEEVFPTSVRVHSACTPGVRRKVGSQSTGGRGQKEGNKVGGLLGKDQEWLGKPVA
jgi:hypothetical protein